MPGIVVFNRRWSLGSDDLVVPASFLVFLHAAWIIVLAVTLGLVNFDPGMPCTVDIKEHVLGYLIILTICVLIEGCIAWTSMRGSILNTEPRRHMQYFIYIRLVILLGELAWLIVGVVWIARHYNSCSPEMPKKVVLGIIICNWGVMLSVVISVWCTFDTAGRKWVKMKRFQESIRRKRRARKHSGCVRRNWRQRKALRAYEEKWDKRFHLLCCCIERRGRNQNSISEVAQLFTEFFRDLDVVPSDVVAGLLLLRRYQKLQMRNIVATKTNDVYQYLSGAAITPQSKFLQLGEPDVLAEYKLVIHFMRHALAAYGWPAYMMINTATGLCHLLPYLSCCCLKPCCHKRRHNYTTIVDDNCCECNFAALQKLNKLPDSDIIYVTYQVDIGKTPFYVAVDHKYKKIVMCVRGTLSLQDVLTDLKADSCVLPLNPPIEDWLGHEGMVDAAAYIYKKLKNEEILTKAFSNNPEKGTSTYDLVLVGHSLGAGTAVILAILLKQDYPTLHCYAYSPPGGLLSDSCVEATKPYITSVIVGKDIVPRIGLSQMELLRTDLINVIKMSKQPKWKIISQSLLCCMSDEELLECYTEEMKMEMDRNVTAHPCDSGIGLSAHKPLYLPGKIIHVVRSHPRDSQTCCGSDDIVHQAILADNKSFEQVLISPTMVNDHFPDNVLEALEKVLSNVGPTKPVRTLTEAERRAMLNELAPSNVNSLQRLDASFIDPVILDPSDNPFLTLSPPLSWDAAATENILALQQVDDGKSANQHYLHQPHVLLDLPADHKTVAPLASPETLSESSSIASLGVVARNSFHKTVHGLSTLDPIQQSPLLRLRSDSSQHPTKAAASAVSITAKVPSADGWPILKETDSKICKSVDGGDADKITVLANVSSRTEEIRESPESDKNLPAIITECIPPPKPPFRHAESEVFLHQFTPTHLMRRSTEQMDIAHLQDDTEIFEESFVVPKPRYPRGRLMAAYTTPYPSVVTGSLEEEFRNLSSHISDKVLEHHDPDSTDV